MKPSIRAAALAAVLASAGPSFAAGLMDSLKGAAQEQLGGGGSSSGSSGAAGMLGGLGLPAIGGNTASNAAGVLQYCMQNKYANGAKNVKDALLSKVGLGGKEQQDPGYQNGVKGLLTGSDGSTFNMDKLKSNLKEKACDYVLDNAKSLL
ncbi:DUF2501 domain-containing protein [Pseudorhodoferax sp. Leaf267]|uniref:DUF2501 domain-containing protein n=1 Tax=Pseudorhodoferax sp. Leaf267 TaxID=1736316 RepID=UPI0006F5FA64|nr:DUF2501 domain-containing protein [Pseudorhodoferax sp. Leaf267]KQP13532.1 hypothetical protein ASF43_16560 [Pseudorhodoferax sp. Leaf267]